MRAPKARKSRRGGNRLSVPKYQRNESNVQFVSNACALEATVGAMCARLPKRWTATRTRYITDCASDVLKNAVRANAIWPKTEDDLARREGHIQEAVGACQELQARLDALLVARPMKAVKGKDGETTRMVPCVPDGLLFQIAEKAVEGPQGADKGVLSPAAGRIYARAQEGGEKGEEALRYEGLWCHRAQDAPLGIGPCPIVAVVRKQLVGALRQSDQCDELRQCEQQRRPEQQQQREQHEWRVPLIPMIGRK